MHYVYILKNQRGKKYVGCTDDLKDRLARHNRGEVPSTAKLVPWHIVNYSAFPDKKKAYDFEKYLKSGSGRSFAERHLL
ncbi:MAG: GIY-YIG nuclease family protein [Kiritimatiellales bacterium]|nr:GIY-YIG nuclease family protein [Kiritimatiellales bacterium]